VSEIDTACLCGGIKLQPKKDGIIYVEWSPEFPGGNDSFKQYLKNNINLNVADSGYISLSFYISCTGSTCGYKVDKIEGAISKASENAILSALKTMSNWKPAKQRDENVDIPFKIKLKIINGQMKL